MSELSGLKEVCGALSNCAQSLYLNIENSGLVNFFYFSKPFVLRNVIHLQLWVSWGLGPCRAKGVSC